MTNAGHNVNLYHSFVMMSVRRRVADFLVEAVYVMDILTRSWMVQKTAVEKQKKTVR